jgi:fatty acid desaturase
MPWLVFHCCLSTMTLARHTAPHIPFRPFGLQYDEGQAALGGCVTLLLPKWMLYIVHNFNYTAVQQVASSVPFHSAPEAHEALRQRLGPYLTEAQPSMELLRNLIFKWQVYDPQQETYVTIDQALAQEPQQQVQQQGEQQQWGQAGGSGSNGSSSSGGMGAGSQMLSMQGSQ